MQHYLHIIFSDLFGFEKKEGGTSRLIKKEGAKNRPPNAPAVFFFERALFFFSYLEGAFFSEPSFRPPFFSF